MHLVLGPERFDLRDRTVVVARGPAAGASLLGADALWADDLGDEDLRRLPVPVGADADDADDVARLAEAGAVAVGIRAGDRGACAAARERGLTLLVHRADLPDVAGTVPPERLLVAAAAAAGGAVACADPPGSGPAAWGAATVALLAGVRVVRTAEPASLRRVATVVDRLHAARLAGAR